MLPMPRNWRIWLSNHMAFEQVMAAVSDFEKGNLRLSTVLASMDVK